MHRRRPEKLIPFWSRAVESAHLYLYKPTTSPNKMPSAKEVYECLTGNEKCRILESIKMYGKEKVKQMLENPEFVKKFKAIYAKPTEKPCQFD